jgi:hypothetical protein
MPTAAGSIRSRTLLESVRRAATVSITVMYETGGPWLTFVSQESPSS